jgi:CheY-like chemotaxis protein
MTCTVSQNGSKGGPVLIIEDDADIRDTLSEVLQGHGYQVATASNGKEGLEALDRIDRPCVILLDLMMPVMSGPEFLEAFHTDTGHDGIPIVIVSAYCELIEGCEDIAEVIPKPMSLQRVLNSVHKYCQC